MTKQGLRERCEWCDRMGAVLFVFVVMAYRLSGRSNCFANSSTRPKRKRSRGT